MEPKDSVNRRVNAVCITMVVLVFLAGRISTFNNEIYSTDEGNLSMTAALILSGGHPYADTIENRTPLAHYLVASIYALSGTWNLPAVRAVWTLMLLAGGGLLYFMVRRHHDALTAGLAFALYVYLNNYGMPYWDALACHNIHLVEFFTIAGFAAILVPRGDRYALRGFTGGILLTLAIAAKQTAVFDVMGLLMFLLLVALSFRNSRVRAFQIAVGMAAGFVCTAGGFVLLMAWAGALDDFLRMAVSFNLNVYGREPTWDIRIQNYFSAILRPAFLVPLMLTLPAVVVAARRYLRPQKEKVSFAEHQGLLPFVCWMIAIQAVVAVQGRGFGHHFFTAFPPMAVLGAWSLACGARWAGRLSTRRFPAVFDFMKRRQLPLLLVSGAALLTIVAKPPPGIPAETYLAKPIGKFVQDITRPQDRILVWGFAPEVYHYARRLPSSRHFVSNLLTGLIPWTNYRVADTRYAIHPDAWDEFQRDFEETPPALFVDLSVGPYFRYSKYPPENYEVLWEYLENDYRLIAPEADFSSSARIWIRYDYFREFFE